MCFDLHREKCRIESQVFVHCRRKRVVAYSCVLGRTHGRGKLGIVPIGDVIIGSIMNRRLEKCKKDRETLVKEPFDSKMERKKKGFRSRIYSFETNNKTYLYLITQIVEDEDYHVGSTSDSST